MNGLRKVVSLMILVVAVFMLVVICLHYDWSSFQAVGQHFDFRALTGQLYAFLIVAGNAIVLMMLGFIGLTMPKAKK